jgi:alkanesulfonate monooxygenase SsuD/methylene tetrahydromethanopterin reductase-like flavin-dependent oxidoreductase (luciferase family)
VEGGRRRAEHDGRALDVTFGVALPSASWPDQDEVWPVERIVEYGVRAERLGFDCLWANDHFWIELFGPRRPADPEPLVLLSHLAARTTRVGLGTLVVCAPLRSPGQLAREAKALAALSRGRFVLGIGAGWHVPEFEAFGIPHDRLVTRFEEYVEALLGLLGERRVDYDGRYVRLRDANVFGEAAPPVWVAAGRPRMLALTGKHAAGWNGGGPPEAWAQSLAAVREAAEAAGRSPDSIVASANAVALLGDEDEVALVLEEHPAPPMYEVRIGAEALRAAARRYEAAGCDHLVLHFSGAIWTSYGIEQLDLAAEALGLTPADA